jgi:hypothetical protein
LRYASTASAAPGGHFVHDFLHSTINAFHDSAHFSVQDFAVVTEHRFRPPNSVSRLVILNRKKRILNMFANFANRKSNVCAVIVGAIATASGASIAVADAKAVVGTLTCHGKGSVGLIVGSKEHLKCTYKPAAGGHADHYHATITKVGLDVGVKGASTLIWSVLGSTSGYPHGALAGQYGGVSADASVGVGGGANALVGGSNKSVVLQPLSVQGQTGLNLAVGVSELTLD